MTPGFFFFRGKHYLRRGWMDVEIIRGVSELNGACKDKAAEEKDENERGTEEINRGWVFFYAQLGMNLAKFRIAHARTRIPLALLFVLGAHLPSPFSSAAVHICMVALPFVFSRTAATSSGLTADAEFPQSFRI